MTAKRYAILQKKNSEFQGVDIKTLSPIDWFMDSHTISFQSIKDGTWHRVFCKHSDDPRISSFDGVLYWLV